MCQVVSGKVGQAPMYAHLTHPSRAAATSTLLAIIAITTQLLSVGGQRYGKMKAVLLACYKDFRAQYYTIHNRRHLLTPTCSCLPESAIVAMWDARWRGIGQRQIYLEQQIHWHSFLLCLNALLDSILPHSMVSTFECLISSYWDLYCNAFSWDPNWGTSIVEVYDKFSTCACSNSS